MTPPMTAAMTAANEEFYVTFGTLAGNAPSYVVREADEMLYRALNRSEYCYVLSSRQMGKSSLMIRTLSRLQAEGVAVAVLDLSAIGFNLTVEQWYNGLLARLGDRLNLRAEAEAFAAAHAKLSPLQRWMALIREVVLTHIAGQIVIFIDEIDIVRSLPFSTDEFFAAIRACYNARAEDDVYGRLTFCLLGVATPSDLIEDARLTPFNIGSRIHLEDFTPTEAMLLQEGLGPDPAANRSTLARILHWTDGHPCLTQRLCKAVVESTVAGSPADVDACCTQMFLLPRVEHTEDNLADVSHRLRGASEIETTELLLLYARVLAGKPVQDDETRPLVARLKLTGVVKANRRRLIVRNRIYGQVFNAAWVRQHLPGAELQRQRAAFRRGVLRTATVALAVIALVTGLAITAFREAQRANRYVTLLARSETAGVRALLYASDMDLMEAAYTRGDFSSMRNLLEQTRDYPYRGFEWFYWQGKLKEYSLTLQQRSGPVYGQRFSADGRLFVTGDEDQFVRIWEVRTGRELHALHHPGPISWVSLSPDGREIASGDTVGMTLCDVATGRCLASNEITWPLEFCTAKSPSWQYGLVPPGPLQHFYLYTWHDQQLISRYYVDKASGVTFTVGPDGRREVGIGPNQKVTLWNGETRRQVATLAGHRGQVYSARFSADSRLIVTCGQDQTAKIWDAETGRLLKTLDGHRGAVRMGAFSPDGRRIVAVGDDRTAIVWDVASGKQLATLNGYNFGLSWVQYSPDGRWIATADALGNMKIREAVLPQEPVVLDCHERSVNTAVFSHSGNRLLTCGEDGTAKVWDAVSRKLLYSLVGHLGAVNVAAYATDDSRILTAGDDGTARVWDATDGTPLLTLHEPGGVVLGAAFSPNGRHLVTAAADHSATVWDAATGRILLRLSGHTGKIRSVVYSPDGRLIATADEDHTVGIWDAVSGKRIRALLGHTNRVYSVAFSPDGRQIVTGSKDKTARIWDVASGDTLLTIAGEDAPVYSAVFSPDGHRILTGDGPTATLWDASNGRKLLALHGHSKPISSVAFSPDGSRIVTADAEGTARIWSAETGTSASQNQPPGMVTTGLPRNDP